MNLELEHKVALITGASRGIGAAIAFALAREGCDVAITHWEDEHGASVVAGEIEKLGRRVRVYEIDAAGFSDAERVVASVIDELGSLDILVCNAGVTSDGASWKLTEAQWDRVLGVNLKGCFNYCRAAGAIFREQRAGNIVNISSINALRGKFGQANYAASKAGVIALTKTLAKELGRYGVNVNAVSPGMVETEMTRSLPQEYIDAAEKEAALGRIATVDDVANVVTFLASAAARHITGTNIRVDGGQAM